MTLHCVGNFVIFLLTCFVSSSSLTSSFSLMRFGIEIFLEKLFFNLDSFLSLNASSMLSCSILFGSRSMSGVSKFFILEFRGNSSISQALVSPFSRCLLFVDKDPLKYGHWYYDHQINWSNRLILIWWSYYNNTILYYRLTLCNQCQIFFV